MPKGKYTDSDLAPSSKMGKYSDADLAVDFSGGPNNTEGQYEMVGPNGVVKVAYSQVKSAFDSGMRMTPTSRATYVKDSSFDPNLKDMSPAPGVDVVGMNSAGRPILGSNEPKQEGSAVGRFVSSAGSAIGGAVKGAYHAVVDNAKTPEELGIVLGFPGDAVKAHAALVAYRMGVAPAIEQGKQAVSEFKQSAPTSLHPTQDQLWHRQKALGHGLATALPVVGPWAAQVGEQVGTQVGSGDIAGGAGTLAGNAALYEAPHIIGKGVGAVARSPRATIEALTDTTPREVRKLGEEVQKKNTDAAQAHQDVVQPHVDELRGKELKHHADERTANEKAAVEHKAEQEQIRAKNAITTEKHKAEAADVKAHNDRVKAKHEETAKQIQDERDAAEHALGLRRTEEATLQKETDDYYAKEDAVKARVKANTDAVWKPWHDKMKGVTVDGADIATPLAEITKISPEVAREIRLLTPDPADADVNSPYVQKRNEVLIAMGHKDPSAAYEAMDDFGRANVDRAVAAEGFTPDPIDLNPQSGVAIPIEKVHRAKSIIQRNVANGRYGYEGPLLGEMKQLGKILDQVETQASVANGAISDLRAGRQATREYMEAFGRDRHIPKNQSDLRKQQANPEQFKEENEQERLDAAAQHDPSLVTDYESVKARREQIKKMKTEDQLRASLKQIPEPPTVGDLREGYNLKESPKEPVLTKRDAQGKLLQWDGKAWVDAPKEGIQHQLAEVPPDRVFTVEDANGSLYRLNNDKWELVPRPRPENLAHQTPESVQIERPVANPIPDRPVDEKADLPARKQQNIKRQAEELRRLGLRRGLYATLTGLPFAVVELFKGVGAAGAGEAVLGGLAAGATVLAGSHMLANLVERPGVAAWISKITPKDAAMWEKLPTDQKALFADDMKKLAQAAKAKGIKISPALSAFIAGTSATQKPDVKQLKKEAEQHKPPSAPGPQSSTKGYTHIYDELKDMIVPA